MSAFFRPQEKEIAVTECQDKEDSRAVSPRNRDKTHRNSELVSKGSGGQEE